MNNANEIYTAQDLGAAMAMLKVGSLEDKIEAGKKLCRIKRYHVIEFQNAIPGLAEAACNKKENPTVRVLAVAAIRNSIKHDICPDKDIIRRISSALYSEISLLTFRRVASNMLKIYNMKFQDRSEHQKRLERPEGECRSNKIRGCEIRIRS